MLAGVIRASAMSAATPAPRLLLRQRHVYCFASAKASLNAVTAYHLLTKSILTLLYSRSTSLSAYMTVESDEIIIHLYTNVVSRLQPSLHLLILLYDGSQLHTISTLVS